MMRKIKKRSKKNRKYLKELGDNEEEMGNLRDPYKEL